ncbi:formate--tetrahydrofolate ligase [Candidatus Gracilibacteria bacterium]|nr:MAG: formate--tetrahydrofolate ligase [Candidatus Gracilibacteria bacterium]
MLSDIEISKNAKKLDIREIAKKLDIDEKYLELYGTNKAKLSNEFLQKIKNNKNGKLILVTACNPIPAGEGKTTTTIGLGQAMWKIGKKSAICLREPALGPVFGLKGGATGGGYSQIVPMEDINLHFTGDFHAITSAHLLLSAAIDNHIFWGNELKIDTKNIVWKRAFDVNDRALRKFSYSSDGKNSPSENISSSAMITTASEIMAIFCLAKDIFDLKKKISEIIFAYDLDGKPLKVKDLKIEGAMTALLKEAIKPNIVQTLENTPCFVHGGPFANIAHGCNSLIATKTALKVSDFVITEAGFGSDLGAEKFFDIKCRIGDLKPDAVVLVSTINSIKYNAGVSLENLEKPDLEALQKGIVNLEKHIENISKYGLPIIICLNKFSTDTDEEINFVKNFATKKGVSFEVGEGFAKGGDGMTNLAKKLVNILENSKNNFDFLYEKNISLKQKIEKIVTEIYGGSGVKYSQKAEESIKNLEKLGFGDFPVCIAKTPVSLSDDPSLLGRPKDFFINITDLSVSAGAGFVVAFAGNIMTMPGLPKSPNALKIDIDEKGEIVGLN